MNRTTVSARHACLKKKEGVWEIRQEGVTNPTYVNGKVLSLCDTLKDGDTFTISKRSFRINYKDNDPFVRSIDFLRKLVQYFKPFALSDYGMMCWKCDSIVTFQNIKEYGCCPYCDKKPSILVRDERVQNIWKMFIERKDVQNVLKGRNIDLLMERSLLCIECNLWRVYLKDEMLYLAGSIKSV